jgi:hypothetical protein
MKNLIFLVMVFLVSCSPTKRLEKMQDKHPDLFYNVVDSITVTVYENDTIKIDSAVYITNDVIIDCDNVTSNRPQLITKETDTHTTVLEVRKNKDGLLKIDTKTIIKPQKIVIRDTINVPMVIERSCPKIYASKWYHSLGWFLFFIVGLMFYVTIKKPNFQIFNPK